MTCEAWLIHKQPRGNSSIRLIFFTAEHGLWSGYYKGGRIPKKQAILQPFQPLWLHSDNRATTPYIKNVEFLANPLNLQGDRLFSGLYINELIFHFLQIADPHPQLFTSYEFTLNALSNPLEQMTLESVLRRFEWNLLKECGYQLSDANLNLSFYPKDVVLAVTQGEFDKIEILQPAKRIMRAAIDQFLAGKELKSRNLFIQSKTWHTNSL